MAGNEPLVDVLDGGAPRRRAPKTAPPAVVGVAALCVLATGAAAVAMTQRSEAQRPGRQLAGERAVNTTTGGPASPTSPASVATALSSAPPTPSPLAGSAGALGCRIARGAQLQSVDWSGRAVSGRSLRCAQLQRANLRSAKLNSVDLSGAVLIQADLRGAVIRDTTMDLARLALADFTGASFIDSSLLEAGFFGRKRATGARWVNTICPDGSNSDANGATCDGHMSGPAG